MSLKPCNECGKQVAAAAAVCPHCGIAKPVPTPPERFKSAGEALGFGAFGGAVCGVILALIGGGIASAIGKPGPGPLGILYLCASAADWFGPVGGGFVGAIIGSLYAWSTWQDRK